MHFDIAGYSLVIQNRLVIQLVYYTVLLKTKKPDSERIRRRSRNVSNIIDLNAAFDIVDGRRIRRCLEDLAIRIIEILHDTVKGKVQIT